MKPLIVLLSVFGIVLFVNKIFSNDWKLVLAGNIALSAMLVVTGIAHFIFSKGMVQMIPYRIPFKKEFVYGTGILEIAAAAGLLFPNLRQLTACLLVIFFICLLPANIHAAKNKIDYQKASVEGPGLAYLWFRVPLQIFFIGWTLYFGVF